MELKQILFLMLAMISLPSFAIISGVTRPPSSTVGPSVNTTPTVTSSVASLSSSRVISCSDENLLPLKLLDYLSFDGSGIRVTSNFQRSGTPKITVRLPRFLSSCLSLEPAVKKIGNGELFVVSVENKANLSAYTGNSQEQKLESCLSSEGILSNGQISLPSDQAKYTSEIVHEFEVSFDKARSSKVVFGSPKFLGRSYGPLRNSHLAQREGVCNYLENFNERPSILFSESDARTAHLERVCRTGNLSEINAALRGTGNSNALTSILEDAQEKALKDYGERQYRKLRELGADILDTTDPDDLEELVSRYNDILEDMQYDFLDPAIERLEQKLEQRSEAESREKRAEIDVEIRALNKIIDEFGGNPRRYKAPQVIDHLLKHGFGGEDGTGEALTIARFTLRSRLFGQVYKEDSKRGRRKKVSFRSAEREVEKELKNFEERAKETHRRYLAETGSERYTPEIKTEISRLTRARDNQWTNDMKNLQKMQQSCQRTMFGFVQNPAYCSYYQQNQQTFMRQAYSNRGVYNRKIGYQNSEYSRYSGYETIGRNYLSAQSGSTGGVLSSNFLGSYGMNTTAPTNYNMSSMPGLPQGQYNMMMGGGNPYASNNMMPHTGGYNMMPGQNMHYPYMR